MKGKLRLIVVPLHRAPRPFSYFEPFHFSLHNLLPSPTSISGLDISHPPPPLVLAQLQKMDMLKVNINPERNEISLYNNGDGVPVEIHKEHGVYVPELIFGHMLTSSNYDSDEKTTGGRNGYVLSLPTLLLSKLLTGRGKRSTNRSLLTIWARN